MRFEILLTCFTSSLFCYCEDLLAFGHISYRLMCFPSIGVLIQTIQLFLAFLSCEADRAEEIFEQKAEEEILQVKEEDWDDIFKLSELLLEKFRLGDENVDEDANSTDS
jgi:hypothetical protein